MRVIAEGVENDAQLELLKVSGCDEIQGFKIARPQRAEDLEKLFGPQKSLQSRQITKGQ